MNRPFVAVVTLFRALSVVLYPVGASSVAVVAHLLLELRMFITADEEVVLNILVLLSYNCTEMECELKTIYFFLRKGNLLCSDFFPNNHIVRTENIFF